MRTIKDLSYEERVDAVNRVMSGESMSKVAKSFDVASTALYKVVEDFKATGRVRRPMADVNNQPAGNTITSEMAADFIERFKRGESYATIAKAHGVVIGSVYSRVLKYRKANGLYTPEAEKQKPISYISVHDLLVEYVTQLKALVKLQVLQQVRGL